jgi:desulfoferrodoxin-like iron-binding protein
VAKQYVCECGCNMFFYDGSVWYKDQDMFKCKSCGQIVKVEHPNASTTPMQVWLDDGDKVVK